MAKHSYLLYIVVVTIACKFSFTSEAIVLPTSYYKGNVTKLHPQTEQPIKYPAFFEVLSTEEDKRTFRFKAIIVKDNLENFNSYETFESPRIISPLNDFLIGHSAFCENSETEKCKIYDFKPNISRAKPTPFHVKFEVHYTDKASYKIEIYNTEYKTDFEEIKFIILKMVTCMISDTLVIIMMLLADKIANENEGGSNMVVLSCFFIALMSLNLQFSSFYLDGLHFFYCELLE